MIRLESVTIKLPYPPSANRYWRVWRGRAVKSSEARAYQAKVKALWGGTAPASTPVAVTLDVVRPQKRGDLDNAAKVILDALGGGCAYGDDSQIVELHMYRSDNKKDPCVNVTIERRGE